MLRGLDLSVEPGEIVGLLGPNGAGKTTALRIAAGVLNADAGSVRIAGKSLTPAAPAGRRAIGYVAERIPLYAPLTVAEQLRFVGQARGLGNAECRHEIERLGETFDLADVLQRPTGTLSRGYRQRVGLAQALLGDPRVLLLDEPTTGLDPFQLIEARNAIRRAADGRAVVLSSHIVGEIDMLCSRIVCLDQGRSVPLQRVRDDALRVRAEIGASGEAAVAKWAAERAGVTLTDCQARDDARVVVHLAISGLTLPALNRKLSAICDVYAVHEDDDLESHLVALYSGAEGRVP